MSENATAFLSAGLNALGQIYFEKGKKCRELLS